MLKGLTLVGVAVGALTGPTIARAETATFDFTGTGTVCRYTGNTHACEENVAFSGEITLEVNAAVGPADSDGSTYARSTSFWKDAPHWVTPQIVVRWDDSSYATEVIPTGSGTDTTYRTEVRNDFPTYAENGGAFLGNMDQLYTYTKAERIVESRLYYWNKAELDRNTFAAGWLSSLAFDTGKTLPPEGEATLEFDTQSQEAAGGGAWTMTGVTGHVTILTLTARNAGATAPSSTEPPTTDTSSPPAGSSDTSAPGSSTASNPSGANEPSTGTTTTSGSTQAAPSSGTHSVAAADGQGGGGSLGGLVALALGGALLMRWKARRT